MRKRTFPSTVQEDRCITGDKNVAVYAMIDNDDTYMLNAQIQELSAYASSHPDLVGWNIVIYQDSGNSSKAGKQPQLKQLIADIRDGKIQCIIVKNLSRIARDQVSLMYYIEKIFFYYKARLIALTENLDTADPNTISFLNNHLKLINERKQP